MRTNIQFLFPSICCNLDKYISARQKISLQKALEGCLITEGEIALKVCLLNTDLQSVLPRTLGTQDFFFILKVLCMYKCFAELSLPIVQML